MNRRIDTREEKGMHWKSLLLVGVLISAVFLLAACSGVAAPALAQTRTLVPTPTQAPTPQNTPTSGSRMSSEPSSQSGGAAFETKSNLGGSVTVDVVPTALAPGEPASFDIAMNTHSVDLSDDLTKTTVLRDDTGKEYKPTQWDGSSGGGHHRSGTLLFPALVGKPKSVELVIKGLAKVPERVFQWDLE